MPRQLQLRTLSADEEREVRRLANARKESVEIVRRARLIEPWWKQLRSLALKGRRFENGDELSAALVAALDYWNRHRHPYTWKKRPQIQPSILLGGFSSSITHDCLSI